MELDHVLIAVRDLADSADELADRYGLISIEGGRHPGWGTANRIVPLGKTYLELIAVVDEAEAAQSAFGRWVGQAPSGLRPLGWAVRTPSLDDVARRLGLRVTPGSRLTPDGTLVRWRSAGIEQTLAEPSLPFFIEWTTGSPFPGRAEADHRAGDVELEGDAARLAHWLGEHTPPIDVRSGPSRVASIALATGKGEVVLGEL